jgi:hypothetical protein
MDVIAALLTSVRVPRFPITINVVSSNDCNVPPKERSPDPMVPAQRLFKSNAKKLSSDSLLFSDVSLLMSINQHFQVGARQRPGLILIIQFDLFIYNGLITIPSPTGKMVISASSVPSKDRSARRVSLC